MGLATPDNLAKFVKAAAFAAKKHSTQRRKDAQASPYINHPLELANVPSINFLVFTCVPTL